MITSAFPSIDATAPSAASTREPPDELTELADLLHGPIIRLWRQLRSEAEHLHLPALHVTLLFQIRSHPGIGVSQLAAEERMRPSAMNVHLRELDENGWIARDVTSHVDRRRVGLVITPAGRDVLQHVLGRRHVLLVRRLSAMGADDLARLKAAVPALQNLSIGKGPVL